MLVCAQMSQFCVPWVFVFSTLCEKCEKLALTEEIISCNIDCVILCYQIANSAIEIAFYKQSHTMRDVEY